MQKRMLGKSEVEVSSIGCADVSKLEVKERLVLTSLGSRDILGALDTPVDIGVSAEKEVIQ